MAFINGYKEEKIYLQITNFLSWLDEMAVLDVGIALQARLWACGQGDMSTPSFGSHLNPISTRGGRLCQPYISVHTKF